MPKQTLSESAVRALLPVPGKQVVIFDQHRDGRGLVLTVNPGGSKTWSALWYDPPGSPRYYKLGRYPILPLAEARKRARKFLADPKAQLAHDAEDVRFANLSVEQYVAASVEANGGHYFSAIAEEFITRHVRARGLRTAKEIERMLRYYVLPEWEEAIITTLRRREVTALISHIEDNHGQTQANRVLGLLSSLFRWYADNYADDDYTSPINNRMKRGSTTKRDRVLSDTELAFIWHACGDDPGFPSIVKLALLKGQRKDKIASMRWDDIKDGVWTIRTEPREKANAGILVLPEVAAQIIEGQSRLPGNSHVFATRLSRGGYFTTWIEGKDALLRKLPPMPRWTVHDLRRTARTLLARTDVGPHIAEMVLGHALGGVEGIYNRHDFLAEKGRALQELAHLIEQIVTPPDNVIPLRPAQTLPRPSKAAG